MKKTSKKTKKIILIILTVLCIIVVLGLLSIFVFSSVGGDKYGSRLKDEKKYKLSEEVVNKIKGKAGENDSVSSVKYHKEGRVLNVVVTVDNNMEAGKAKEFAESIVNEIPEESRSYYDIQIFIDSTDKSDTYPIIAYKGHNSDAISFGNVGEKNE